MPGDARDTQRNQTPCLPPAGAPSLLRKKKLIKQPYACLKKRGGCTAGNYSTLEGETDPTLVGGVCVCVPARAYTGQASSSRYPVSCPLQAKFFISEECERNPQHGQRPAGWKEPGESRKLNVSVFIFIYISISS